MLPNISKNNYQFNLHRQLFAQPSLLKILYYSRPFTNTKKSFIFNKDGFIIGNHQVY